MKGRSVDSNPKHRFLKEELSQEVLWAVDEFDSKENINTKVIEVFPKTIINEVKSSDLPFIYSLNPYQGCEHGCAYCYARPTHEYWGYGAGIDFESVILVKKNAPALLEAELRKPLKVVSPIVFSGNTDCYQPLERKLQITRQLLQVCKEFRFPVSIITKNALVLRDLDILKEMAEQNLVSVTISITSVDEDLRKVLEPRTSTYSNRFKALQVLSKHNIPCGIMVAPIIPGLNDKDIPEVMKQASENGAKWMGYTIVRLNDSVEPVFIQWLEKHFPNKKERVLELIRSCHNGQLHDTRAYSRFAGDGKVAESIHQLIKILRKKYFADKNEFLHNCNLYTGKKVGDWMQGSLF